MDIKLGTVFTLFQPARPRLVPSYFLCVFRSADQTGIRQAITTNAGNAQGPLLLTLEEGVSDPLNGVVTLYSGDWVLTVYEQTSPTNLDAALADRNVWRELVRVSAQCDADPGPQPYDPCDGCPGGGTLCEEIDDGTAVAIVACIDDAGKTAAVQALICDPSDDATVDNSDGSFTQAIPAGDTYTLDDYDFVFQDPNGVVTSTEVRPAMVGETFIIGCCPTTFLFNLNINGVFSQVVTVDTASDININL